MVRRAFPTVRPHKLSLGVMTDAPVPESGWDGLSPPLTQDQASDLARAMLVDSVTGLQTFPVRFRMVFVPAKHRGDMHVTALVPASWQVIAQRELESSARCFEALDELLATGVEAALVIRASAPMASLGEMFDALMWLVGGSRMVIGNARRTFYALGASAAAGSTVQKLAKQHGRSAGELRDGALELGLEAKQLTETYLVESVENVRRLHIDAQKAAFAPSLKRYFDGDEIQACLGIQSKHSPTKRSDTTRPDERGDD